MGQLAAAVAVVAVAQKALIAHVASMVTAMEVMEEAAAMVAWRVQEVGVAVELLACTSLPMEPQAS